LSDFRQCVENVRQHLAEEKRIHNRRS
jgi:hypothetical protein